MYLHSRTAQRAEGDAQLSQSARHLHTLVRREGMGGSIIGAIIVGAIAGIVILVGAVLFIRRRRKGKKAKYERAQGDDTPEVTSSSHALNSTTAPRSGRSGQPPAASSNRNNAAAAGGNVDRNTSVRSVMTLPAYRQMAGQNEQVLGREGERDGIDVIVDLPTEEEMEALRDEEMESMYQIRVARRQLIQEQQQRRVERQEARRRGDTAALSDLRARTRAANNSTVIDDLRREMERAKENRNLSVSSVSYADVGLARHDGTRIRANSTDSERMGLLSDSASIGMADVRSQQHNRGMSVSSVISMDSNFPSPALTRSAESYVNTPGQAQSEARAGSSPELLEADLGDESMPPPGYEDVSLADDDDFRDRPVSQIHEPPPDYPGHHRSGSQRSQRSLTSPSLVSAASSEDNSADRLQRQSIPRLPSLQISDLPAIVVEPSSAQPPEHEGNGEAERRQ
ncbi:growth arrest and dna-damage-inducible s-interacting 1 domain-containing [Trichoderma arundinaceum]|uniref:Growth arrest and dna-damage-inducible s-interacting 1 domain-containing n=1 Tax=Trichoderma arundinaceum TaxID=490622 RepID=A0A395NPP5_TRIAR|nr:growth arrest and dna-damage-inducible s-interacting 1 domain-containing [Trichoderma arundinaceum]